MTFAQMKERARAEWEALERGERPRILIGTATCGRSAGALDVLEAFKTELAKRGIDAVIVQVGCIGLCYAEPLVDIIKKGQPRICYHHVTPELVSELIDGYLIEGNPRPDLAVGTIGDGDVEGIPRLFDLPMLKPQVRFVLRNCGHIDPENINHYIANNGYAGLAKALKMGPEEVIEEIKKSGLRGRGGAGFPTGLKWEFCRKSLGKEKYLICNADEGDPGAFMDRSVLEGDPHAVLEGMVIAAHAIGARQGYVYCRAEYPLALERLRISLQQMREYGFLGENILGSGLDFDIEIKEGAGAFVCGEETALIASLEGRRGMPCPRPPFPAQSGLWGKPTNINNVETFANVSIIMAKSSDWYASYGTGRSKGTKTFALAGKVKHTGLIEISMGITLRELIFDIGGGVPNGRRLKAVQIGGPSGGCLPEGLLDVPIDYESLREHGAIMGSGGVIVLDDTACMVDVAKYFLDFTAEESCGKCVPCRIGIPKMLQILEQITSGEGTEQDLVRLRELAELVSSSSLCALGQTAPNPVRSTLRYFEGEYLAHIYDKTCPAGVCPSLVRHKIKINPELCQACDLCRKACPTGAIQGIPGKPPYSIDDSLCIGCEACLEVCPFDAIQKLSGKASDCGDDT
jgi:NADH-quinone oxidoreductase subunit F